MGSPFSLSMLAMIGAGGAIATQTHASTVNAPQVQQEKQVAPQQQESDTNKQNTNIINDKARAIHQQLLSNGLHNSNNTNSTPLKSPVLSKQSSQPKMTLSRSFGDESSYGLYNHWGSAHYNFDSYTGNLEITGDSNGNDWDTPENNKNYNGGFNTITTVRIPNTQNISPSKYESDMSHYTASDFHHNINPSDIRSITVNSSTGQYVQLPNNSSYVFANLPNLTSVNLTGLHTPAENSGSSDITSTSHMFANDPNLQSVTLGNSINPADLNNMSSMFSDDPALTNIDLGTFPVNHTKNMDNMFNGDTSLNLLDLSKFNTSNNTSMNNMLKGTSGLQTLALGPNTILNESTNLPNASTAWYKRDVNDDYTNDTPVNITNGTSEPGVYTLNKNFNTNPDSYIIKGTWLNAPYSFNKQTGVLQTTGPGKIEALKVGGPNNSLISSLQGMNLNDINSITEIDIDHNNTIYAPANNDFCNLPNLRKINLSGLNTSGMTNTSGMFSNDPMLKEIDFGNHFDTSQVSSMSFMFSNDKSLSDVNLSQFNTSNVTDMSWMFANDANLSSLNLDNFNTSYVNNMGSMFYNDGLLSSISFSNQFNTSDVTNMSWMFADDPKLSNLNLSSFNTFNVTNMSEMFYYDADISNLDLSGFYTSRALLDDPTNSGHGVSTMKNMFYGLDNLKELKLGPHSVFVSNNGMPKNLWYKKQPNGYTSDTPMDIDSTNNDATLDSNRKLAGNYVLTPNINPSVDTSNKDVTGFWGTAPYSFDPVTGVLQTTGPGTIEHLRDITQLKGVSNNVYIPDPGNIDPSKIKDIKFAPGTKAPEDSSSLFASETLSTPTSDGMSRYSALSNLSDIDVQNLDTTNVDTMNAMFAYDPDLQHIDNISKLNTSSVVNMNGMFYEDHSLLSLDLSSLDMSNVKGIYGMFENDFNLSNLKLSSRFDNNRVIDTHNMFKNDYKLDTINLGSDFVTSDVSNMSGMFENDTNLINLDLGPNFDTQSVTNMSDMFSGDNSLRSLNLGPHFNTVNVNNMYDMFGNDTNLQNVNLGENFNTSQAFSGNKVPEYTSQGAWQEPLLVGYFNGASDIFSKDTSLNTISGSNIQLSNNVNLPVISGKNWYLRDNNGQLTGNPVDLTNGNSYSGTYTLNKTESNPIVQTTLQFLDGSNNIGNLVVTGYNNTPIPYGLIDDSLGDGYSPDIPGKELAMNIPNSSYKYTNGIIQVPVKHDGESSGTNPVSATYVTLQGNITLNFTDYKNSNIKTLTIPYQIDGVPVGSKVSNILSHATPSVTAPRDYLGKTIQSFPISDYSYQNGSNDNSYLNIPITVSDSKNSSGQYEDGNPVTRNLTFNFKSNKVNENITYEYKSTNEGSTDIQGDPGTKGNDADANNVKPGFVPTPNATTSFTFTNNGSMTIPVQPEQVTVPFKVEDNSSHQVLSGLSDLESSNKLFINKASIINLNSNDLSQLTNDGYQLDGNQAVTVPLNNVNTSTHTYNGNDFVLYAHKFNITVPVRLMYNGQQKSTSSLTGTMNDTISNINSKLASAIPAGYQIDSTNSNEYTITHISSESNDKYQTSPLVVNIKPISTINYIKYMNNGQQIGSSYKVNGYDNRAGLGHDTFTINSKQPAGLENGYHVNNDNQTINLNNGINGVHKVNVSPDTMLVPVEFKDITSGSFLNYSPNANGSFTVNTPGTINFGNDVLSELQREGYQLSHTNDYSFTITPNEVRNDGTLYPGYEPTFNVTPIPATATINYEYNGHDVTDNTSTKSVTGNQSVGKTTFDLASLTVPNGYQLTANNPATDAYKSGHVTVNVTPVQATDAIVYKNGSQTVAGDSNSTNSVKGNKVIAPNSFNTNSLALPNGYKLAGNGINHAYDGSPVEVQVAPKPTMTTIHYEYNGQPLNITTKPGVYNASFDTSSLNLPNGYNLANSNQTIPDSNADVTVNLVPQQKTDTINFVDNQGNVSTTHVTGNSSATDLASSHFTVGNAPTGLPSGYQVENPNQVINYDGGNYNIMIKPVSKPTPKPQPVTPSKPSSGSTSTNSSVKPNSNSTGSSASPSASTNSSKNSSTNSNARPSSANNGSATSSANTSKNNSSARSSASSSNVKPISNSTNSSSASHNASSASTNNSKSNSSTSANVQPSSANSSSTNSSANTSENNNSASSNASNSAKPSSMNSSHASSTNSSSTNIPKSSTANSTASNSTQPNSTSSNTSKSNGSINSSTSMNSSAKSNSTSSASNTSNASSTSTNIPESASSATPVMPIAPTIPSSSVSPGSVVSTSASSSINTSVAFVSGQSSSATTGSNSNSASVAKPYKTRTDQGYVIQHNASHSNHDVVTYHGRKHVVHYHANGKNTIRVRERMTKNGKRMYHYKNVVVSTNLPTNNVPEPVIRAVDTINFNQPAKHVWSWKSANKVLNQINVGEVIDHYGTKMARISVPAHYRYFIVNKQALAHLLINKVGKSADKYALPLKKELVFHINRIIVMHGHHGNYVRYEFRFNKHNLWITARGNYVKNAYLQTSDVKGHKIQITRKCCLYTSPKYSKHTLIRSIKPGVKLSVKKVIFLGKKSNYQTRLLLSNGDYVTANKQFVEVI